MGVAAFLPATVAAEELTIYDKTNVNVYVPIYGYYGDNYQKTEYVIPSKELTSMVGSSISGMTYYIRYASSFDFETDFTVFLKEVDFDYFNSDAFQGEEDATIVYEGGLVADSNKQMVIPFTTDYVYKGGNLLVGIYKGKGKYASGSSSSQFGFYGDSSFSLPQGIYFNSSSSISSSEKGKYVYFLPKTTFKYDVVQTGNGPVINLVGFNSNGEFIFGEGNPVPEDSEKVFTIKNNGDQNLEIKSVTVNGGFKLDPVTTPLTIEPGNTVDITIKTPAEDAQGKLEITSNDEETPHFVINLKSTYKVPAPVMVVTPATLEMGKVTADAQASFTIKNEGDAALVADLSSSNNEFTVNPSSVNVAAGDQTNVTVAFVYNESYYGLHSAEITVTPTGGLDPAKIAVSAKVQDPDMWTENFEANALPEGWEAGNLWTFEEGVAKTSYKSNTADYLITPALSAKKGDELSFQYKPTYSTFTILVEGSKDGVNFTTTLASIKSGTRDQWNDYTLSVPEDGTWRFRFKNEDYWLDNFEGLKLDNNAPVMVLSSKEDAVFGKVTASPAPKTYTVTNTGTGLLEVDIACVGEDFEVSPLNLAEIAKGESKSFEVRFNHNIEKLGERSAVITVTPKHNASLAVSFNASAIAKDPNNWEEDFEDCTDKILPGDWTTDGWTVSSLGSYQGGNGTLMAYAGTSEHTLTTPRLYGEAGKALKFDVGGGIDTTDQMKIQYSNDGNEWKDVPNSPVTATGPFEFTAPESDYYYLRFTCRYGALDNFNGFRPAPKTHDVVISQSSLPEKAAQLEDYVATVTLAEKTGQEENVTLCLEINGKVEDTKKITLDADESQQVKLTYIPVTVDSFTAKVVAQYADGTETVYTSPVTVVVTPAPRLAETEELEVPQGRHSTLILEYSSAPGWTTISLPFQPTGDLLSEMFGDDFKIFEFKSYNNGLITFKTPDNLAAGYAYVVYAPQGTVNSRIVLKDVQNIWTKGLAEDHNGVTFQSTFKPLKAGEMNGMYALEGSIVMSGTSYDDGVDPPSLKTCNENSTLKGFRGYFMLDETVKNVPEMIFYDEDRVFTVVNNLNSGLEEYPEGIYNLQGIRQSRFTAPGLYIVNGKKVIIR